MKPSSQRGIALIITLIMLSVVTVMAIVFLGVSRRERAAVGVISSSTDARLAADAATARAQAEVIARIAARSNRLDYDFFVSTNFINPLGFDPSLGVNPVLGFNLTNVNYTYRNGNPVAGNDLLDHLKNLYLDPRPPVFITTNSALGLSEFRYYLDLNRNRVFDTNGVVPVVENNRLVLDPGGLVRSNFHWGDPEWIGGLEHPDQPHSASNKFIYRYAYAVLPTGKSLDLNFIHNRVKPIGGAGDYRARYMRNQGIGSWEINLAGFLAGWLPSWYGSDYAYANNPLAFDNGTAFETAGAMLRYRYGNGSLPDAVNWFGPAAVSRFQTNLVDDYGDGLTTNPAIPDSDNALREWPGQDNVNLYVNPQELFDFGKYWYDAGRTNASTYASGGWLGNAAQFAGRTTSYTSDRYAFPRLLSQMGVDSVPANRDRIHVNYVNGLWQSLVGSTWTDYPVAINGRCDLTRMAQLSTAPNAVVGRPIILPGTEVNMVPWATNGQQRVNFLMLTAERLLQSQYGGQVSLQQGIPIYPTNFYGAGVHRCLQLAANILDSSTTARVLRGTNTPLMAPTVFRPIIGKRVINGVQTLWVLGYEELSTISDPSEMQHICAWWDPAVATNPRIPESANFRLGDGVYGIPWVVGAKKGWPNFNELYLEATVLVTRRMQVSRPAVNSPPSAFRYDQSYEVSMTNVFGLELWNAYTSKLDVANCQLIYTNLTTYALRDNTLDPTGTNDVGVIRRTNSLVSTNLLVSNFGPKEFLAFTNRLGFVPPSRYYPGIGKAGFLESTNRPVGWTRTFDIPDWKLVITNRMLMFLIAPNGVGGWNIVDVVTFNNMMGGFDITRALAGEQTTFGGANRIDHHAFWRTNRLGNQASAMTWGITNQLYVSTNSTLDRSQWSSWSEDVLDGRQRDSAIAKLRAFYRLDGTNTPGLTAQVPFSPTRRLVQRLSWMANDPLVHYHIEDIYDPVYSSTNANKVATIDPANPDYRDPLGLPNLRAQNPRYRPWGGGGDRQTSSEPLLYLNVGVQDPLVYQPDDWEFPTNVFAHLGWLGRVHRGTPWQTVYLKSRMEPPRQWLARAGRLETHPTNDWRLLSVFTSAPNENATRGLLGVNQTNYAAWAAVLAGVELRTNSTRSLNRAGTINYDSHHLGPLAWQITNIVQGLITNRLTRVGGTYNYLGEILSAPALTGENYDDGPRRWSPLLDLSGAPDYWRLTDSVYEGLPQQILGLLKDDEPVVAIYAYGQSLRPADRSQILAPGPYYGLITNYQITGEALTKTLMRLVETKVGTNTFYDAVVENFKVLPLD